MSPGHSGVPSRTLTLMSRTPPPDPVLHRSLTAYLVGRAHSLTAFHHGATPWPFVSRATTWPVSALIAVKKLPVAGCVDARPHFP